MIVDNYARQAKGKLIDREKLLIWKTKLVDKLEFELKSNGDIYWVNFLMETLRDPVLRLLTIIIVFAFISSGPRRIVWPVGFQSVSVQHYQVVLNCTLMEIVIQKTAKVKHNKAMKRSVL